MPLARVEDSAAGAFAVDPAAPTPIVSTDARPGRAGLLWWIVLGVIVADQIAKALVRSALPLYDSVTIIPGLVDFIHVHNTGVAFGVLNEANLPFKTLVTVAMASVALAGIGLYSRHVRPDERIARVGLSLILGGATGNLVDRLRFSYVVDFVDVYWRSWHFWAFNLADAAITIGAVFVFVDLLLVNRYASRPV
jgi:signal peptidase II